MYTHTHKFVNTSQEMMETWVLSETLAIAGLQGILKDDILCQISQDLQLSFNHLNQLLEFKRVRGDSYSSS